MSDMKTVETDANPDAFLSSVEPAQRAEDARSVMDMMARLSGFPPRMWGDSIIGFGSYSYQRRDGSTCRFFRTGLSPRKTNLSIYIMPGFKAYGDLLSKLGPHKHSVSCLYVTRLSRIDTGVLETLIKRSLVDMSAAYPE